MQRVAAPAHRLRRLWLAIGWTLVALVVYLSLAPEAPGIGIAAGDKLGHVLAYTILMWWFVQLYAMPRQAMIAIALATMGVLLELLQPLTEARGFEALDILANAGGIAVGWLLAKTRLGFALKHIENWLLPPPA